MAGNKMRLLVREQEHALRTQSDDDVSRSQFKQLFGRFLRIE